MSGINEGMDMGYAFIIDTDHTFNPLEMSIVCPGMGHHDDYAMRVHRAEECPNGRPHELLCLDAAGMTGPCDASDADLERLSAGEGWSFKLYDDDETLLYSGRLVVSGGMVREDLSAVFGPLEDFGAPYAGATDIRWAWDGWRSA